MANITTLHAVCGMASLITLAQNVHGRYVRCLIFNASALTMVVMDGQPNVTHCAQHGHRVHPAQNFHSRYVEYPHFRIDAWQQTEAFALRCLCDFLNNAITRAQLF